MMVARHKANRKGRRVKGRANNRLSWPLARSDKWAALGSWIGVDPPETRFAIF